MLKMIREWLRPTVEVVPVEDPTYVFASRLNRLNAWAERHL